MALSSVKSPVMVQLVVGWSHVYRLNKKGAATAPCETPALTNDMSDKTELYWVILHREMSVL